MFGDKLKLAGLLKNAGKIQEMMEQAQEKLNHIEVVGEAGAGMVKVTMTAKQDVKSVKIDPELLKEDTTVVEELMAAAISSAIQKALAAAKDEMSSAGGIGDLLGGA